MQLSAYLCQSRHGVYYFRWPIPARLHPQSRRSSIKLSLRTRCPKTAKYIARLLSCAGQIAMADANLQTMRYDQIRNLVKNHYQTLLDQFRERVNMAGRLSEADLAIRRSSLRVAGASLDDFVSLACQDDPLGFVGRFCDMYGVEGDLSAETQQKLLEEIQIGQKGFLEATLAFDSSLDNFEFDKPDPLLPQLSRSSVAFAQSEKIADVVTKYLEEGRIASNWTAKTVEEKRETLALLVELIGQDKPMAKIDKRDAQDVKAVLLKLPKNRNKMAATRGLSARDAVKVGSAASISITTVNGYLSDYQAFNTWAVNNGYAEKNMFEGMRVRRVSGKASGNERKAFNEKELRTILNELVENPKGLVRKDSHKWGTLIALFTGARLNEVSQLHLKDIKQVDDIWCFDINDDESKTLKTVASKRVVPIHEKLIELGLLEYVECIRQMGKVRLFYDFSYSEQNGYGRTLGRWFNEVLLVKMGLKSKALVFHSLRHSMVTELARKDVPEPIVKTIVGHERSGVTQQTYFKSGYTTKQLHDAVNKYQIG